ncbi:ApbA-domain-containing protein [Rhodotorula sp. JG-1b]|nr:ApbA-domain-containing protein [Rhodotorula sp. JG-1b]
MTIDVLVIGMGAVGTVYGYVLSQNSNVQVTAIARSSYDAMKDGIHLKSDKFGDHLFKPYRIVKDAEEANDRPYKYILCAMKCLPDLLPTASILAPFLESKHADTSTSVDLEDGPTVVLLQNGVGIEVPLAHAYPHVPIISSVVWVGANLLPGGVVTHGSLEQLIMGLFTGEGGDPSGAAEHVESEFADPHGYRQQPDGPARLEEGRRRTQAFGDLINNGGGCAVVVDEIQPKRYEKNLWNAAFSSMCAMSRRPVSEVVSPASLPYTLPVVRRTMLEVIYVARAWGITEEQLPLKTVDDTITLTIRNYQRKSESPGTAADAAADTEATLNFKPSMLLDVEAGRPAELEPILGSLLDRARAKGVPTPRLDVAYAVLKCHQAQAVEAHAQTPQYQEHIRKWLARKPTVGGLGTAGRKAWDQAIKRAGLSDAGFGGGKDKIPGKPVQ